MRCPATKGVGVLCSRIFGRSCAIVGWSRTVCDIFVCFKSAIAVLPNNRVTVKCRGELCYIGYIANNLAYNRRPTAEHINVLCIRSLLRLCAVICRHCSVCNIFVSFERGITILPRYCVFVQHRSEDGGICNISICRNNFGCPSGKHIGILCIGCFCWLYAIISGRCTILNIFVSFERGITILPSNSTFVRYRIKHRGVGCIFGRRNDLRRPSGKHIGILCIGSLGGFGTIVCGNSSFAHISIRFQYSITIFPSNCVLGNWLHIGNRITPITIRVIRSITNRSNFESLTVRELLTCYGVFDIRKITVYANFEFVCRGIGTPYNSIIGQNNRGSCQFCRSGRSGCRCWIITIIIAASATTRRKDEDAAH